MIKFSLFRIPVGISWWCLLGLAIIANGLEANSLSDFRIVFIGILAGFISLLGHEMGHALMSRNVAGGYPVVVLEFLGGFMVNETAHYRSKKSYVSMIAAGPGFNISLAIISALIFSLTALSEISGSGKLIYLLGSALSPIHIVAHLAENGVINASFAYIYTFLAYLICFNSWWALFNLLPIWPMDGGKIMGEFIPNPRNTHMVSMILSALLFLTVLYFFQSGGILMLIFLGIFFFNNLQAYKSYQR